MGCATEAKHGSRLSMSGSFVVWVRSAPFAWPRPACYRPVMSDARPEKPVPNVFAVDDDSIAAAAGLLLAGELVAFPTETVYGLGGDATNDHAVAKIFEAKGRPRFNPLIVHVSNADAARALVAFDRRADRLAAKF